MFNHIWSSNTGMLCSRDAEYDHLSAWVSSWVYG